jgi:hypothetical protein
MYAPMAQAQDVTTSTGAAAATGTGPMQQQQQPQGLQIGSTLKRKQDDPLGQLAPGSFHLRFLLHCIDYWLFECCSIYARRSDRFCSLKADRT